MPKVAYIEKRFRSESLALIERVNRVIADYNEQGYSLTLRQVYYQMVARDIIQNNERSYKNLGSLISDARLAGMIDWDAIEDRTRNLRGLSHWDEPGGIIKSASYNYHLDHWKEQENYIEVWVEKDALVGIVGRICNKLDVNYFSCRGYVSQSEMWQAAERLRQHEELDGKNIILLHLGDHDPSGIDMSRDIIDRNKLFNNCNMKFKRLALNMNQVDEFMPPPNPTKVTDSRASEYISKYGYECWELDALEPSVISDLIMTNVEKYRNEDLYKEVKKKEEEGIESLKDVAANWTQLMDKWDEIKDDYF